MMKGFLFSAMLLCISRCSAFQSPRPAITIFKTSFARYALPDEEGAKGPQQSLDGRREFLTKHIAGALALSILSGNPTAAHSEEIKTLDMSLPSYSAANTLKVEEKAMGVEAPSEPVGKAKPAKKKSNGGGGGGGSPLGNVLPSMNKSVGKKPRSSGGMATASERPAKRVKEDKADDEIKTLDLSLPSYSEGTQAKEKSAFSL